MGYVTITKNVYKKIVSYSIFFENQKNQHFLELRIKKSPLKVWTFNWISHLYFRTFDGLRLIDISNDCKKWIIRSWPSSEKNHGCLTWTLLKNHVFAWLLYTLVLINHISKHATNFYHWYQSHHLSSVQLHKQPSSISMKILITVAIMLTNRYYCWNHESLTCILTIITNK